MAAEEQDADRERHARTDRRIDIVATVLLSLATLATAWAGYQSSRWHSEQALDQQAANKGRIESTQAADTANREAQVDINLFIEWVNAHALDETELADFYRARFTDRLQPVFDQWIRSRPFTNPDSPPTPFAIPSYRESITAEAQGLDEQADAASAQAAVDIERADRYVLAVVLFASCLFFAGISTRLRSRPAQIVILAIGCTMFVGTAIWIGTFPVR